MNTQCERDAWTIHANRPNDSTNFRVVQYIRHFPKQLCDFGPLITKEDSLPAGLGPIDERQRKLLGMDLNQ